MYLPVAPAGFMYTTSQHVTSILVDAITTGSPLELSVRKDFVLVSQSHHQKQLNAKYNSLLSTLF